MEFLPPPLLLVRTLSEQHWSSAIDDMKNKNTNTENAGNYGLWTYKIVRSQEDKNKVVLETYFKNKLISYEATNCMRK